MRIGLRADASNAIGTGHVMRQAAIGLQLQRQGATVLLIGSISGPDWLQEYIKKQRDLEWVQVPEGNFTAEILGGLV